MIEPFAEIRGSAHFRFKYSGSSHPVIFQRLRKISCDRAEFWGKHNISLCVPGNMAEKPCRHSLVRMEIYSYFGVWGEEISVPEQDLNVLYCLAKEGNRAAEQSLFACLSERFRAFARRRYWGEESYEDIVQDALATISREYEGLQITSSFAAWAYKVLKNRMLTVKRTQRLRARWTIPMAEAMELLCVESVEPDLGYRLLRCLEKIGQANVQYARILNLHYQGYTTEEICARINIPRNTFYTILFRARAMLRNCLEKGEIR